MKPEESDGCHQTLSHRWGLGSYGGNVQRQGLGEDKEYVAHKMKWKSIGTYPNIYINTVKKGVSPPPSVVIYEGGLQPP